MSYERQNFKDYQTILTAAHMNHIEDGIAAALVPENTNVIEERVDILEDSTEYWNINFLQTPQASQQTFGEETLVPIQGKFADRGQVADGYITSPLIRLDTTKSYEFVEKSAASYMRQLRIFNKNGGVLCGFGNNKTQYAFGEGLSPVHVKKLLDDPSFVAEYPTLSSTMTETSFVFNCATLREFNLLHRKQDDSAAIYIDNEPVYMAFTFKATSSRPQDENEELGWFYAQTKNCNLYNVESYNSYELNSLSVPKNIANKYYQSPILYNIISEIGSFIKQIGMSNAQTTIKKNTKIYSETMTENFYPSQYHTYYIASNFKILDVNTPTYKGYTYYSDDKGTVYKITIPIPMNFSIENISYICEGFLRHYGLFDIDGNMLYYDQNKSDLTINEEFLNSLGINPLVVKYMCVSNQGDNAKGFKVTETITNSITTYELPNLQLTSEQSAGGGGTSTGASNVVNLSNVDRIVSIGDSYTESHYTIKDKAWMSKVSLLTDYNCDNFALSGDTYRGQLNKIREGKYPYASISGMTWEKLHPNYAIMICKTNDTKYMDCQQFVYDMEATIEATKGLGAIPIIATEYHVGSHDFIQTAFDYCAKKYGGYFVDLTEKTYKLRGQDYGPFWGSSHPGLRANHMFSDTITKYINKNLPRPYSAIKIFRARDNSLISNLDNYLYSTIEERAEKFKEISICHSALVDPSQYDNCAPQPENDKVESEYFKLMTGNNIKFNKVCLIDAILPTTVHDISQIKLITNNLDNVSCYVKDSLAAPYPIPEFCRRFDIPQVLSSSQVAIGNTYLSNKSTANPVYQVVEILYDKVESSNGFVDGTILICRGNKATGAHSNSTLTLQSGTGNSTLSCSYEAVGFSSNYPPGKQTIGHYVQLNNYGVVDGELLRRAMDNDKITFLLISDSEFNLSKVEIQFKGNITKTRNTANYHNTLSPSYQNEETSLITHKTFDSNNISYWLKNDMKACGIVPEKPVDNVLPSGITQIITLKPEDGTILQHFKDTTGSTQPHNANYKVKIWARYFPPIFDPNTMNYPDDSLITEDSFDWAKLDIKLYQSASDASADNAVKMTKLVGMHWDEIELDITLPPANHKWYLGLTVQDKPVQLAYATIV